MGLFTEAFKHCVEGFACGGAKYGVENFEGEAVAKKRHFALALAYFLLFIVVFVVVLLIGKYLWNEVGSKYITILKPIPSVVELLGIMVLAGLIFPGSM
jgi:hypothetical protein